jgi:hypothetical protein
MPNLFKGTHQGSAPDRKDLVPLKPTPSDYAAAFMEQAGLDKLGATYKTIVTDVGTPVGIIEKKLGGGLDWRDRTVLNDEQLSNGWLVLERLSGAEQEPFRARVFKNLAGATAEFCLKLKTHEAGAVAFHQIQDENSRSSNSSVQLEFNAPGRQMLLSHVSVGLQVASRLMGAP